MKTDDFNNKMRKKMKQLEINEVVENSLTWNNTTYSLFIHSFTRR